ncbi:MAG TPA: hypothetical protein VE132_05270 [Micromonosporaceae bacterium]|nr:hypothetical protein [Micromonosporaceae bacterium]
MNYAVTELNDTTFNLYSALLAISGILLAVTAATGFGGRSVRARILNGIFAVAFLAYAFYLQFIFTTGTVFISYYVFVVPILLIVQAFRNRTAAKQQQAASAARASATGTPYAGTPYAGPGIGYPNPQSGYPPAQPGTGYPNPQSSYQPPQPGTGYPHPQSRYQPPQPGSAAQRSAPTSNPAEPTA